MKKKDYDIFIFRLGKELKIGFEQFLDGTKEIHGEPDIELFRKEQSVKAIVSVAISRICNGVVFSEMHGKGYKNKNRQLDYVCLFKGRHIGIELKYCWIGCGSKNASGKSMNTRLIEAVSQVRDFRSDSGNWDIDDKIALVIGVPYLKWKENISKEGIIKKEKYYLSAMKNLKDSQDKETKFILQQLVPYDVDYYESDYVNKKIITRERYPSFVILSKLLN